MISAAFLDRANSAEWVALFASVADKPFHVRREVYRDYIRSAQWKYRRSCELRKACNRCARCGMESGQGIPIQVHHISYKNLGAELPDDLVVLCKLCHSDAHGKGEVADIVNTLCGHEDPVRERIREENKRRLGHYAYERNIRKDDGQ